MDDPPNIMVYAHSSTNLFAQVSDSVHIHKIKELTKSGQSNDTLPMRCAAAERLFYATEVLRSSSKGVAW